MKISTKQAGLKVLGIGLSAVMIFQEALPLSASSIKPNTDKEEVVYIKLGQDGSVSEINAVNIFDLEQDGEIIDYGSYQSVRNMTSTDEIQYANDVVSINAKAGKLYYEGKLSDNTMPWNIAIHYYIDGIEYTADQIAGMSGALTIKMSIKENTVCDGNFFDHYALQASVTLDTSLCKNIDAPDATTANVGNDKQLTYTILPGKGADIEITADVTDFEMDGIAINAIPLNLNIEVDDKELMDQVKDLQDAIKEVDTGTGTLKTGTASLKSGASTLNSSTSSLKSGATSLNSGISTLKEGGEKLKSGTYDLKTGASDLESGIKTLNSGIEKIEDALTTLDSKSSDLTDGSAEINSALQEIKKALDGVSVTTDDLSALVTASGDIRSGIDTLTTGITELQQNVSYEAYKTVMLENGLDIDELKGNNEAAMETLQTTISSINDQLAYLGGMGIDTSSISDQLSSLQDLITLMGANNAALGGVESYLDGVNDNLTIILEGAQELQTNYAAFDDAIAELANTLSTLAYQMGELSSAITTLATEYEKLDTGINDYTDGVAQILAAYSQVSDGAAKLVTGSGTLTTGTQTLYKSTGELLSGITTIYNGSGTLKDGTGKLSDGTAKLVASIAQLYTGTGKLKDGTAELKKETRGMDKKITDKVDDMIDSITGDNEETISFTSTQNTNIESVQFVMTMNNIEIEEPEETVEVKEEKLSFGQKFLRLFGIK